MIIYRSRWLSFRYRYLILSLLVAIAFGINCVSQAFLLPSSAGSKRATEHKPSIHAVTEIIMSNINSNLNGITGRQGEECTEEPLRDDDDRKIAEKKEDEESSEDADGNNNPRRGRPGIVVFSGGTAFNAASAEMASRVMIGTSLSRPSTSGNDGSGSILDRSEVSRSNSMSSLFDLMAMGSVEEELRNDNTTSNNINNHAGGTKVWHVLPVTDDGGSTAEIVRILGGPAVGDIRSRLLRLAPGTTREARAVRRLLGHRLVSTSSLKNDRKADDSDVDEVNVSRMAREEWLDILDGGHESYQDTNASEDDNQSCEHPLWKGVSAPYRSIIRAFLLHFHNQVLQQHNGIRQSQSNPAFNFEGGSIGNFFFAGARIFFGSLPAAIFLFSKVANIPSGSRVVPAVLSQDRLVLGVELKDGSRIRGQYQISHPSSKSKQNSGSRRIHKQVVKKSLDDDIASLHSAPIKRVTYLLHDPAWRKQKTQHTQSTTTTQQQQQWTSRNEINPEPNPQVLDAIANANLIVYGCGSLFTSVLPSLVLEGVGSAVSSRHISKVLLLNGWQDFETSWVEISNNIEGKEERTVKQMDTTSIVQAVADALDRDVVQKEGDINNTIITDYITHIFYPKGTEIQIDEEALYELVILSAIDSIPADMSEGNRSGGNSHQRVYNPRSLVDALLDLAA